MRTIFQVLALSAISMLSVIGSAYAQDTSPRKSGAAGTGERQARRFDFGSAATQPGYTAVGAGLSYDPKRGFGWVSAPGLTERDRQASDALRRDYVFGRNPAVFRVNVEPGLYRLTLITGDMEYGDHVLKASVDGVELPQLEQGAAEFSTLTATVEAKRDTLDLHLGSPTNNWVLNALSLEPVAAAEKTAVTKQTFPREYRSAWGDVAAWSDPTAPYVKRFRQQLKTTPAVAPTGLTRADYLKVIAGNVDFFRKHQNADGAIIDPYRKVEFQYSTPAFAHAAALLAARAGRKDLLEPAAKALDWSARTLSEHRAASRHEDFFPPMLAHAIPLLKPLVPAERSARWEADIRRFDPYKTYRAGVGGGNWNVVALSGEALFHQMGLRENLSFVEDSLARQGREFSSHWGLYLEGPMAYDHFPRLWAADMIAHGYSGKYAEPLREVLRRAALTSLFMQSPAGELPAGGRSAHHQWNEAQQCVTYEIYAARALKDGDPELAGVFKRAAHLALGSMRRWIRPSGEMWIVKNRVDPALGHASEGYSAHSQYNLLPMSMLAIAYEHAESTENIAEKPAPADLGGYVLQIDPELHKVFANAGGMYIEIDTAADHHYDATGLIRVHARISDPQLGPSDSLSKDAVYRRPEGPRTTAGIGAAWKGADGAWRRIGELNKAAITKVSLADVQETPDRVSFRLEYEGSFGGPTRISERYVVTPDAVQLTTEIPGYAGPLQYVWPVLADNGAQKVAISVEDGTVSATLDGKTQTFTPIGAASVRVEEALYANHNGWARLGVAEYPAGGRITLRIAPKQL